VHRAYPFRIPDTTFQCLKPIGDELTMKKFFLATGVLVAFGLFFSLGQVSAKTKKKKVKKVSAKVNVVTGKFYKKKTVIVLTGGIFTGTVQSPDGIFLRGVIKRKRQRLLKIRSNWKGKLKHSIGSL